jgi:hypothetical protein
MQVKARQAQAAEKPGRYQGSSDDGYIYLPVSRTESDREAIDIPEGQ